MIIEEREEIASQLEQIDINKMIQESWIISNFDEIHMNEQATLNSNN